MANWLSSGNEPSGFEEMQQRFCQMLQDGRHIFDAASNALVGGTDPEVIREDLFVTDQRINGTEQKIRRQIVVHGTVHGVRSFPAMLVLMSLAKDAERIGDYAKNIFELAVAGPHSWGDGERENLVGLKDRISRILAKVREVYEAQDAEKARAILAECDELQKACEANVKRALEARENAAGFALASRFFKRVASHAANVATSLVMPLDKLDFFDEP